MQRTQIYLSDSERQGLQALALRSGRLVVGVASWWQGSRRCHTFDAAGAVSQYHPRGRCWASLPASCAESIEVP